MAFILSKILWMFAAPGNFLVLALLASVFLALSRRAGWQAAGHRLCFDIAFLLFFIAIFPAGQWMLVPLENRFPPAKPDHVDGIIVIGGDENAMLTEARGQPSVRASADFYLVFATLARAWPQARLVYAGGASQLVPLSKLTNAEVAKEALTAYDVPIDRVTFETKSRTTHENAVDAAMIVHPKPSEKWLLVTSAHHMPRAIASFRKEGWNVYAAPADYYTDGKLTYDLHFDFASHLGEMTMAAHEYFGLIGYWLMGYTDALWPKP
jgi:uncharacterized SAM-binding protein YcdF (DUF218 family)